MNINGMPSGAYDVYYFGATCDSANELFLRRMDQETAKNIDHVTHIQTGYKFKPAGGLFVRI